MITFSSNITLQSVNIKVTGHANQNEYGKDIVCAGVSTLIITHSNLIKLLSNDNNYQLEITEGYYEIKINHPTEIQTKICQNILHYLQDLAKDYPKYMKEKTYD